MPVFPKFVDVSAGNVPHNKVKTGNSGRSLYGRDVAMVTLTNLSILFTRTLHTADKEMEGGGGSDLSSPVTRHLQVR